MTNKLVVSQIIEYGRVRHSAPIMVFVPEKRPLLSGDFEGDFIWRRTHNMPFTKEEVLEAVRDTVIRAGHLIKKISYSRYAGCGICPCSPGYLIYTDHRKMGRREPRMAIYLEMNKGE